MLKHAWMPLQQNLFVKSLCVYVHNISAHIEEVLLTSGIEEMPVSSYAWGSSQSCCTGDTA